MLNPITFLENISVGRCILKCVNEHFDTEYWELSNVVREKQWVASVREAISIYPNKKPPCNQHFRYEGGFLWRNFSKMCK